MTCTFVLFASLVFAVLGAVAFELVGEYKTKLKPFQAERWLGAAFITASFIGALIAGRIW